MVRSGWGGGGGLELLFLKTKMSIISLITQSKQRVLLLAEHKMMFTINPPEFEDVRGLRLGQFGEGENWLLLEMQPV